MSSTLEKLLKLLTTPFPPKIIRQENVSDFNFDKAKTFVLVILVDSAIMLLVSFFSIFF